MRSSSLLRRPSAAAAALLVLAATLLPSAASAAPGGTAVSAGTCDDQFQIATDLSETQFVAQSLLSPPATTLIGAATIELGYTASIGDPMTLNVQLRDVSTETVLAQGTATVTPPAATPFETFTIAFDTPYELNGSTPVLVTFEPEPGSVEASVCPTTIDAYGDGDGFVNTGGGYQIVLPDFTVALIEGASAANNPPVANDDDVTVVEDSGTSSIPVLGNDTDGDDDTLSIDSATQPDNGTAAVNGSNVDYTPAANFFGTDTFTYEISDGNGGTDTATVTVTVEAPPAPPVPPNQPPVAGDDDVTVLSDQSTAITPLGNDTDEDGDELSIVSVTRPDSGGTATVVSPTEIRYSPTPGARFGPDSFTYTISDGNGGTDTATVTIAIRPEPQLPDRDHLSLPEGTAHSIRIGDAAQGIDTSTVTIDGDDPNVASVDVIDRDIYILAKQVDSPTSSEFTVRAGNGVGQFTSRTYSLTVWDLDVARAGTVASVSLSDLNENDDGASLRFKFQKSTESIGINISRLLSTSISSSAASADTLTFTAAAAAPSGPFAAAASNSIPARLQLFSGTYDVQVSSPQLGELLISGADVARIASSKQARLVIDVPLDTAAADGATTVQVKLLLVVDGTQPTAGPDAITTSDSSSVDVGADGSIVTVVDDAGLDVTVDGTTVTATSTTAGTFDVTVEICDASGELCDMQVLSFTFTNDGATNDDEGTREELAETGSSTLGTALWALLMLAVGTRLLRRRA